MKAKMAYVLMDTIDPGQMVPFWSELLGVGLATTVGDGDFVLLEPGGEGIPAPSVLPIVTMSGRRPQARVQPPGPAQIVWVSSITSSVPYFEQSSLTPSW